MRRLRLVVGLPVLAVVATLAARILLQPWVGTDAPLLLFIVPILACGYVGGPDAAVLATVLSALAGDWFLIAPRHSFAVDAPIDRVRLGMLAGAGAVVALAAAASRRSTDEIRRRAREAAAAAESLRESQAVLRLAEEAGQTGSFEWNGATGQLRMSPALERIYGIRPGPAVGDAWLGFVLDDDVARVEREFLDGTARRAPHLRLELRVHRADGVVRWVETRCAMTYAPDGALAHVCGAAVDVTDRRERERELRAIAWLLEPPAPSPPAGAPASDDLTRLNRERRILDAAGPDILRSIGDDCLALLDTSISIHERGGDYALRGTIGGWCSFMDACSRAGCGAGDDAAALASGRWHCHESHRAAACEAMETGRPADVPCRGGIRLHAAPIVAGDEVLGAITFGYGAPPLDAGALGAVARAYDVSPAELRARAGAHDTRPAFLTALAKAQIGSAARLIAEIVRRKELEEELQARVRDLDDAGRRKDEFLAMLAHELRNPLAPIRTAVEILRRVPGDAPAATTAREMIGRQVHHLVRLVDDLLDVARVTRGSIVLRRGRVDLRAVVREALETTQPLLATEGHVVHVALPDQPVWLDGDHARLVQVVTNLLDNAAKYTEPGGTVTVRLDVAPDVADVTVRDTGIGIPPETLPHVFDVFVQEQSGLDRSRGGLGIGLTLARRLVELHGGRIAVESAGRGRGSEFRLTLPRAAHAAFGADDDLAAPAAGTASRDVLLVEDNVDAADSLAVLLQLHGHRVRIVHHGAAALALPAEAIPDVVILDLGLPDVDGYEVARRLRARPAWDRVRFVALSGYGRDDDKRRAAEAGFDLHLTKPVDAADLQRALAATPAPAACSAP